MATSNKFDIFYIILVLILTILSRALYSRLLNGYRLLSKDLGKILHLNSISEVTFASSVCTLEDKHCSRPTNAS